MPQPLKILIVEDNPADAELVVRQLRRDGFEPDWERVDTEAAYVARLHAGIKLILSDYEMPQFNGLRALDLLNASGLDIPFILISGTIGEETAVLAMRAGASDYLLKDRLARLGPATEHALAQRRLRGERKQAEMALRESERRFRELLENAELLAMTLDKNGVVTFCNDFLLRLTGWSRGEVVGFDWYARFSPELPPELLETFAGNIERGEIPSHYESPIALRTGGSRQITWNNTLLRDAVGTICGTASIGLDVTDQKAAGDKIRDQLNELLRWQEVMLNREDRVLALKQEVNELLAQQKLPARYSNQLPP